MWCSSLTCLFAFMIPIFCNAIALRLAFFVASPTEIIFKARGCARVNDTRMAKAEYFFSSLYFSQLTARHNLTSQSMQLINTERATLQYTR